VEKVWGKIHLPDFLHINFLRIYYQKHPQVKHFFVMDANMRLYAQIFKLTFNKTKNYLQNNSISNIFLSFINFNVLYLTNSFITNIPAFISDRAINLNELLNAIKHNYSLVIIPDFLFENMKVEDDNYTKIEIEEEMSLTIRSEWNGLEDYMSDLRKKYRNKVKSIIKRTSNLKIKNLDSDDLENYALDIQKLFTQVVTSSRFKGPLFNVSSFISFVKQDFMTVNGYFLNDKLVGFSSAVKKEKILYSYFVGFDKTLNKSFPIYGRILIENIISAITLKKECLILGRTANEYKSNFGAIPVKSYVYLKVKNKFIRIILRPIYSKLSIRKWKQRSPFKIVSAIN
jgi:hypothetical protein